MNDQLVDAMARNAKLLEQYDSLHGESTATARAVEKRKRWEASLARGKAATEKWRAARDAEQNK